MTPERARELFEIRARFGGYGNPARRIRSGVTREHGEAAVDEQVVQTGLDRVFRFEPGTRFVDSVAHAPPGGGGQ